MQPKKSLFSGIFSYNVRAVVATGIGAALFVVMAFIRIPVLVVPNTSFDLGYAVLALFAAIFGPIAGLLVGFVGHTLRDIFFYGSPWWSWIVCSGILGFGIGLLRNLYNFEEGFTTRKAVIYNVVQAALNLLVWGLIAPTLDILIYAEPASKVYSQGIVAAALNIVVMLVLGTLLFFGYVKAMPKSGSLRKE